MSSRRKRVNHTPADVRKTKKRKVQAANAKTKQENMASRINVGKQAMKRLLLPMAIFETEGESEVMDKRPNDAMPPDSTVDGNTVKEACTFAPFFSIPKEPVLKMPPSELTLSVLENHLQMKIKSICDLKTIAAEEATNPYQSKDYTRDTVDPKCKPEHSVECSLAWLLDEFTKAELLVPEDWKITARPIEETPEMYYLPNEWKVFLKKTGARDQGLFPDSPGICDVPIASSDEHLSASQKKVMEIWRKTYALGEHPARNHLLATGFQRAVSTQNDLLRRDETHREMMAMLTKRAVVGKEPEPAPGVKFLSRKDILARNRSACEGNIMYNEDDTDPQNTPQVFIKKWLSHCGNSVDTKRADYRESEMSVEREAGHPLHGLHPKMGVFTTRNNQKCKFPPLLTYFGSKAKPDSVRRPTADMLPGWYEYLRPATWVTEGKTDDTTPIPVQGAPQVGPVVMPTIIMLILFYLDTRPSPNHPLPPWAFMFSLLYNKDGYHIYVHYPQFNNDRNMWGAYTMLFQKSATIFKAETIREDRIHALAIMQRMQSHELFLVEKLMEWSSRGGYERCIKVLGCGHPGF